MPADGARRCFRLPDALLAVEASKTTSHWRDIWGWLGILTGAAVFVAALAVPQGDTALLGASISCSEAGGCWSIPK
jgi:hypothetical protein